MYIMKSLQHLIEYEETIMGSLLASDIKKNIDAFGTQT